MTLMSRHPVHSPSDIRCPVSENADTHFTESHPSSAASQRSSELSVSLLTSRCVEFSLSNVANAQTMLMLLMPGCGTAWNPVCLIQTHQVRAHLVAVRFRLNIGFHTWTQTSAYRGEIPCDPPYRSEMLWRLCHHNVLAASGRREARSKVLGRGLTTVQQET